MNNLDSVGITICTDSQSTHRRLGGMRDSVMQLMGMRDNGKNEGRSCESEQCRRYHLSHGSLGVRL